MEGKNVEENKARDKWCSLCVSCGERPRLINRHIDTRCIEKKLKIAGFLFSKKKKLNYDYKSCHNDAGPISLIVFVDIWWIFLLFLLFLSFLLIAFQRAIFENFIELVTINNQTVSRKLNCWNWSSLFNTSHNRCNIIVLYEIITKSLV